MLATLTAALLLAAPPAAAPLADKDAAPTKAELFAGENWYKEQKGDEQDFVGVLSRTADAPKDKVGFGRTTPYRLTMNDKGKQTVREVYAGAHPELLAPYVGRKVRLLGKAVDLEVEGHVYAEIWPARLEVVDEPPAAGPAPEVPQRLDLLLNNKVYQSDPNAEKEFVGVLKKKMAENAVGYSFLIDAGSTVDKQDLRLLDNNYDRLAPYDGQRVKITGKKVSTIEHQVAVSYVLPAKLEVLPPVGENPNVKELKIFARADWKAEGAAPLALAIRSPKELVLAHGEPTDKATDEAAQQRDAELAARMFKVETIDWKTHMILVASAGARPTGGYTVEITSLVVQDDVLLVHWKLNAPKPNDVVTQSFTHPAQAVLAEYYGGKVVFDPPPKGPVGK